MKTLLIITLLALTLFAVQEAECAAKRSGDGNKQAEKNKSSSSIKEKLIKMKNCVKSFMTDIMSKLKSLTTTQSNAKETFSKLGKQITDSLQTISKLARKPKEQLKNAEKNIREIESRLKNISGTIDNAISRHSDNAQKYLFKKTFKYNGTFDELQSKLEGNEKCSKQFTNKIDEFSKILDEHLKKCIQSYATKITNFVKNVKKVLVGLPEESIKTLGNTIACINRPGLKCFKPVEQVVGPIASTLSTILASIKSLKDIGSWIEGFEKLDTETCLTANRNMYENKYKPLYDNINKCLKSK